MVKTKSIDINHDRGNQFAINDYQTITAYYNSPSCNQAADSSSFIYF